MTDSRRIIRQTVIKVKPKHYKGSKIRCFLHGYDKYHCYHRPHLAYWKLPSVSKFLLRLSPLLRPRTICNCAVCAAQRPIKPTTTASSARSPCSRSRVCVSSVTTKIDKNRSRSTSTKIAFSAFRRQLLTRWRNSERMMRSPGTVLAMPATLGSKTYGKSM